MEPPDEYAPGDRVRNKYVMQPMTVDEVYASIFRFRYRCVWTDEYGDRQYELFRAEDLTPDDTQPGIGSAPRPVFG